MNLPTIDVNKLFSSFGLEHGSARAAGAVFRIPHSCHIPIHKYGEVICGYRFIRLVHEVATIHVERVNDSTVVIRLLVCRWIQNLHALLYARAEARPNLGKCRFERKIDACL